MSTTDSRDTLLWVVVLVAAILLLGPMLMMAFAVPMMGGWMMGGPGAVGTVSPLWGVLGMLVPLAIVVGLGYLGYRAVRGGVRRDPALEELRVAYARGDVSDEEFERRREQLERDREP